MTRLADFARLLAGHYGKAPRAVPKPGGTAAAAPEPVFSAFVPEPLHEPPVVAGAVPQTSAIDPVEASAPESVARVAGRVEKAASNPVEEDEVWPERPDIVPVGRGSAVSTTPAVEASPVSDTEKTRLPPPLSERSQQPIASPVVPPALHALAIVARQEQAEAGAPAVPALPEAQGRAPPSEPQVREHRVEPVIPSERPESPRPVRMEASPTPAAVEPPPIPTLSIGRINIKIVAAAQPARQQPAVPSVSQSASIAWRRAGVGKL